MTYISFVFTNWLANCSANCTTNCISNIGHIFCLKISLPAVWSEVEIFALIEIPQREEPLRIEYHRFGSTLDFSTRPAMDPSFSSNMTHEEMSALFEGDLDVGSKYGASHMLSLIPRLINAYEGYVM